MFRGCLQFGEAYPCPSCICSRSGPRYTSPRKSVSLEPEDEHISPTLPSAAPRKAGIDSLPPRQSSLASRIPACPSVTLLPLVSGGNGGMRHMGVWSRSPQLLELLGLRHSKLHSQGVRKPGNRTAVPPEPPRGRAPAGCALPQLHSIFIGLHPVFCSEPASLVCVLCPSQHSQPSAASCPAVQLL